ncbi:hypothetical protein DFH07DRAFT_525765 [Mycena maculata]|uniref:Uncharacterized protein n=1 Tax=Mycena maculata TaxID=230809 RepID=A0AAD7IXR5_9AGAR|nr:hypothetical protein DFH07DRAFT_525765 [Mycena maculata]
MLASSSLVVLMSAAAVMANTHQSESRNHNGIAMRMKNNTNTIEQRDSYTAVQMTWYPTDTGPDACTGKNHLSSDWYVAMGYDQFAGGSGCCGRQMKIDYNGKSAIATCVDECATCPGWGQLDLTEGLFEYFVGDPGIGVFYGSWSYYDGSETTTSTTSTTHKTTSTTSTHKTTSTSTTEAKPTTSTAVEKVEVATTSHTSSSAKPSSSKAASSSKASSSAKASSSVHSSSAKASSSAAAPTTTVSIELPTETAAVGNVGAGAESTAGASVAGALTGGTSGVASLGAPRAIVALAVVALAAVRAL